MPTRCSLSIKCDYIEFQIGTQAIGIFYTVLAAFGILSAVLSKETSTPIILLEVRSLSWQEFMRIVKNALKDTQHIQIMSYISATQNFIFIVEDSPISYFNLNLTICVNFCIFCFNIHSSADVSASGSDLHHLSVHLPVQREEEAAHSIHGLAGQLSNQMLTCSERS